MLQVQEIFFARPVHTEFMMCESLLLTSLPACGNVKIVDSLYVKAGKDVQYFIHVLWCIAGDSNNVTIKTSYFILFNRFIKDNSFCRSTHE